MINQKEIEVLHLLFLEELLSSQEFINQL